MERLLGLDPQLLHDAVLLAISVFVLFVLLSYLLFTPVRTFLENRRNKIAADLETAKNDKESAETLKEEYEDKLRGIEKEIEEILSAARRKGLATESRIIDEAKQEATRITRHAEEQALLEKKRVLDEMKQEMVSIASVLAGKVVSASIDTTIQNTLVEETLKEMGESTWLS
ncbi:hypothetical protein FACS1894111_04970 [Clostridia bacterium]|nr:hypothetical protein FACS1894111_04970 [Clostridia bacterium]